jgi:N4-gp56 family major capsid protein
MADTGLTEVAATVEEIVSGRVQEVLTAEMVVPQTISDFSAEVGPGMDKLKIPKFGQFTVETKAENVAVTPQVNAFSTDDLDLNLHNVIQFLLEDIASLQSKVSVSSAYMDQAGRDMAENLDSQLLTALAASPSAAAPDHIINFANDPTDTLSRADVLAARRLLNVQKVAQSDRFMVVSPLRESEILDISDFIDASKYGSAQPIQNGEIGRIYGFTVIMHPLAGDDATLWYHRSTHAFARQRVVNAEKDRDLPKLADLWSLDHIWGEKGLDAGKRIVKLKDGGL